MTENGNELTFEFDFGMDQYRGYVIARDSRIVRMASAGTGVCVLLLLPFVLPARTSGAMALAGLIIVFAALLLLGGVFGRLPWFSAARRSQAEAYLSRHGATPGQGSFRQRVVLADDGITVAFGPHSRWPQGARTMKRPWSDWKRCVATRDGLLVECRTGQGGCLTALLGYNMLRRMLERDGFQDVFVPASALGGADARELVRWAQGRIDAAR